MKFLLAILLLYNTFLRIDAGKNASSKQLRILYFVPRHQYNRSHANFAISVAKILQREHSVRIIVAHIHDKDKFDDQTTKELGIEYYKFGCPAETVLPTNKKAPILMHVMQAQKQFWFNLAKDMMENKDFMDKLNEVKYDVGVAEWIADNTFAYLMFHALNIPNVIQTRVLSPNALELETLGLTDHYIENDIPINEEDIYFDFRDEDDIIIRYRNSYRTKFGDHRKTISKRRLKQIRESYRRDIKRKRKRYGDVDDAFRMIRLFPDLGKIFKTFPGLEKMFEIFPGLEKMFKRFPDLEKMYETFPDLEKRKIDSFPGLEEMFKKSRFFLVNTVPQIEFDAGAGLMKQPGKVKMIGGVHLPEQNKKLIEFEDIAHKLMGIEKVDGIVLISFGTVFGPQQRLTDHQFSVVLNTVKSRPSFLFIWQMPTEDVRANEVHKLTNVYTAAFLPQPAILADTRTKAFVSHCGRNSQIEAAYFGVPLVCVPVDFDQLYNAESMARQRMGVVLDRKCVEPKKKNPNRVEPSTCFTQSAFNRALDATINRSAPFIDEDTVKKVRAELQERRVSDIILGVAEEIANDAGGMSPVRPSIVDRVSIQVPIQDRKKG